MRKRQTSPNLLQEFSAITERMQAKDEVADRRLQAERGQRSELAVEQIRKRDSDTRPLNPKHVEALCDSIGVLGLIEPLVVDQDAVLLAGGHRLAAIERLQKTHPDRFAEQFPQQRVPVRMMPFVAAQDPARALQVEVAENEQRRDYTPAEVRSIADHLMEAGYADVKGRPASGIKPLMPALSVVIGKNRRTIQRYLHGESPSKSRTDVQLLLKKAQRSLQFWQQQASTDAASQALSERLPDILALIEAALAE
jgi:ParB family chromosome partitioning protein